MKRVLALMLVLTSIVLTLASCGAFGIGSSGGSKSKSETKNYGSYTLITTEAGEILGGTVVMGEFPQTLKANDVTVASEADENGYYLGSDGERYARLTATPNERNESAKDYVSGDDYYFKVEPIRWKIAKVEDNAYCLVTESTICARIFDQRTNDYTESDIRKWLNGEFLEKSFTDQQFFAIHTTEVDNSKESYKKGSDKTDLTSVIDRNGVSYKNTFDKVFLQSRGELFYGTGAAPTDYALAMGYYAEKWEFGTYLQGWTRSSSWDTTNGLKRVMTVCGFTYSYIPTNPASTVMGIRPCIRLVKPR